MAVPTTRAEFTDYCLRRLGQPVIKINISADQVSDRIDDALKFWRDYHYRAAGRAYLKHQITPEDQVNMYVTVPDDVLDIVKLMPFGFSVGGSVFSTIHYAKYQFMLQNVWSLANRPIAPFTIAMSHLETLDEQLGNKVTCRFNRVNNRVYLDTDWEYLTPDSWLLFEAWVALDGARVWDDRWLAEYATALIKRQWGENLTKYKDTQLFNGMQFNGSDILSQAIADIRRLEDEVIEKYSLPPLGELA
jgi:hypothetical protein